MVVIYRVFHLCVYSVQGHNEKTARVSHYIIKRRGWYFMFLCVVKQI